MNISFLTELNLKNKLWLGYRIIVTVIQNCIPMTFTGFLRTRTGMVLLSLYGKYGGYRIFHSLFDENMGYT